MRQKRVIAYAVCVTLGVFLTMLAVGHGIIGGIAHRSSQAELAQVTQAVRSAALACYAVEGAYPASLDYLREHYGLHYDERIYTVAYSAFASNIFPDVYVMEGGDGRP